MGVVVQLIGLLLCWTVVGAIVGIPLIIVGRRVATRTFVCHCGNEMTKDAKIYVRSALSVIAVIVLAAFLQSGDTPVRLPYALP
jgi:hypothetical protein